MDRKQLIAARIKRARLEADLSQRELGKLYGVSDVTISEIERGISNVDVPTLERLASILGKPFEWFLSDKAEVPPRPMEVILREAQQRFESLQNALCCYEVPMRGSVPCGIPGLEQERVEGHISIPRKELDKDPKDMYVVRAAGNCLRGDGIQDGDMMLIDPKAEIINGKIYVVRLEKGFLALHVYKEDDKLRLVASNEKYESLEPEQARVEGRVILSGSDWRKH